MSSALVPAIIKATIIASGKIRLIRHRERATVGTCHNICVISLPVFGTVGVDIDPIVRAVVQSLDGIDRVIRLFPAVAIYIPMCLAAAWGPGQCYGAVGSGSDPQVTYPRARLPHYINIVDSYWWIIVIIVIVMPNVYQTIHPRCGDT